ncbi:MAG: tetratricopeptide repeat protein [Planctomycetota bacterium]|nr:tetratricopeptide repeat protein [Planctomycetota bacterium]
MIKHLGFNATNTGWLQGCGAGGRQLRRLTMDVPLWFAVVVFGLGCLGCSKSESDPSLVEMPKPQTEGLDPDSARALTEAYTAAILSPEDGSAWGKLGMNYYAHEVIPESLICFEQAEKLDSQNPRWPYLYGMVLAENNTAAGLAAVERAVELEPENNDFRLRVAEFLLVLNRTEESYPKFEKAKEEDPSNPRAWLGLARLAFADNRWQECRELAAKALALAPARPDIVELLSQACFRAGDRDAAQQYADGLARLQGASTIWSDSILMEVMGLRTGSEALLGKADQLAASNQFQESLKLMDQVVRMNPGNPEGFIRFTQALLNSGNLTVAGRVVADGIRQHPDNAELLFLSAVTLANVSQPGPAVEQVKKAVKLKPDYAEAYFVLGKMLAGLGQSEDAIAAFRKSLQCEPGFVPAQQALEQLGKQ